MKGPHEASARAALPAAFACISLVFLAIAWSSLAPAERSDAEFIIEPSEGETLGRWMDPSEGAFAPGYVLDSGQIAFNHARFSYRHEASGAKAELVLHHVAALDQARIRTRAFALEQVSGAGLPQPFWDGLEAHLRQEESAWKWTEVAPGLATPPLLRRLANLQLPVAWFLLAQLPFYLALAYMSAWRSLRRGRRRFQLGLGAATSLGAVARLILAPHRVVTLYVGYRLTTSALNLHPIPRYGVGTTAFHHALLQVLPADHLSLIAAHAVIGVLGLPLLAVIVKRVFQDELSALLATSLVAVLPLFVSNDCSDANIVPPLWWALSGLVLWLDWLRRGRGLELLGASALLLMAMISRPELPFVLSVLVIAVTVAARGRAGEGRLLPKRAWLALAPLLVAGAALLTPHLIHVLGQAGLLAERGSLPLAYSSSLKDPSLHAFVVTDPVAFPAVLLPLAFVSLLFWRRRGLLAAAALLGASFLISAVSWIDMDPSNALRVQIIGALLVALVAGRGLALCASWLATALPSRGLRALAALIFLALLSAGGVHSARAIFTPTNEDAEEAFIREARAALPEGPVALVRLAYDDVDADLSGSLVHLYFPDYLFDASAGDEPPRVALHSIRSWLRDRPELPSVFFLGMRCYTPERRFWKEHPQPTQIRPRCAEMIERYGGEVLVEREVWNRGDVWKNGYYDNDRSRVLRLALVRLRPPAR